MWPPVQNEWMRKYMVWVIRKTSENNNIGIVFLRPESICDLQNTSSENQSTIDLVIKDASLALKG